MANTYKLNVKVKFYAKKRIKSPCTEIKVCKDCSEDFVKRRKTPK